MFSSAKNLRLQRNPFMPLYFNFTDSFRLTLENELCSRSGVAHDKPV